MSRAEEIAAKIAAKTAKVRDRQKAGESSVPVPATTLPTPQVKDVRLTVDLSPARYRDLQGWLNDAAVQLGRSRVTKQDALAALVGLLLRDDVTARKVLAEIRESE